MVASTHAGIPWSFTAHRYDVVLNNLLAEKLRSARFGRFIAGEMLATAGRLVPPDALRRAVVLHMGVALPPPPAPDLTARETPVVLCPARLVAVKGHLCLLEAAALLAGRGGAVELWWAGGAPGRAPRGGGVAALGLARVVRLL